MIDQMADMLIPIVLIFIPALMMYEFTDSQEGLMVGGVMGLTLNMYADLLEPWWTVVAVLALTSMLFRHLNVRGGDH